MTLLTGLTEDGLEVPVQVKPDGRLVAEGLTGPAGPAGPQGVAGPAGPQGGTGLGAKAWGKFTPGSDSLVMDGSLNVHSVDYLAAGSYRVHLATPVTAAATAIVSPGGVRGVTFCGLAKIVQETVLSFRIDSESPEAPGVLVDLSSIQFVIFD